SFMSHGEFELPRAAAGRDQLHLERADLGDVRAQVNRDHLSLLESGQRGLDRGQLFQLAHVVDRKAGGVVAPRAGGEETERRRIADDRTDFEAGQIDGASFLHAEWRDADTFYRWREAGHRG